MRLPNGYGSVYKLSGKRRRPYAVSYTTGWELDEKNNKTKQKRINIGYYATKAEALEALANYNQNPYDISVDSITFSEVYEKWSAEHFKTIVPSACRTWISAYKYFAPLYSMRFKDIRVNHLEGCINNAKVGDATKQRMKSLSNLMYRYALKHEIVDKDYSSLFTFKRAKSEKPIILFTKEQIALCWANKDFPYMDMLLIGLYSGWRPQELATLKINDVDLERRTFLGGLKTESGKNRIVPIHSDIYDLVVKNYDLAKQLGSDSLFNDVNSQTGYAMTYDKYRRKWDKIKKAFPELSEHHMHETRHTFISQAKECHFDDYILKLIVGHYVEDITERVYTHRKLDSLIGEMEKLKY